MVSGEKDDIFPIKPAKRTFNRIKALYSAINSEDNALMVVGNEGHRFYAEDAWKIINNQIEILKNSKKKLK